MQYWIQLRQPRRPATGNVERKLRKEVHHDNRLCNAGRRYCRSADPRRADLCASALMRRSPAQLLHRTADDLPLPVTPAVSTKLMASCMFICSGLTALRGISTVKPPIM